MFGADREDTRGQEQDIQLLCEEYARYNKIPPELYTRFNVKAGLRNADGTGVLAGLTQICNVHGYILNEGEKTPIDGELIYRGIDLRDLVKGCMTEKRFCFEETAWLLLLGHLPTGAQLNRFQEILSDNRELPDNFTEDMIMKAASPNIMNMLARSVLALYPFDPEPESNRIDNVMRQCIELIARMPVIMAAAYQVRRRVYDGRSMYLHNPNPEFSTAENIAVIAERQTIYRRRSAAFRFMFNLTYRAWRGEQFHIYSAFPDFSKDRYLCSDSRRDRGIKRGPSWGSEL